MKKFGLIIFMLASFGLYSNSTLGDSKSKNKSAKLLKSKSNKNQDLMGIIVKQTKDFIFLETAHSTYQIDKLGFMTKNSLSENSEKRQKKYKVNEKHIINIVSNKNYGDNLNER